MSCYVALSNMLHVHLSTPTLLSVKGGHMTKQIIVLRFTLIKAMLSRSRRVLKIF